MSDLILVDTIDRGIAAVTLNRPERRNALSIDLLEQLCIAVERLASDPCAACRDPAQRRPRVFGRPRLEGSGRQHARGTIGDGRCAGADLLQNTPADLDRGRTRRSVCRRGGADGGL